MGSSSKGGGGGGSKTYNYFGSIAGLVCVGETDEIFWAEVDDKLLWSGSLLNADSPNPVSISIPGRGRIDYHWGREDQITPHEILTAAGNTLGHDHPAYTGISYFVLVDFLFGQEKTSAPNIRIGIRRRPRQSLISGPAAALTDGQANPFAIEAELFTNQRFGRGLDASLFASSSWQGAADASYARQDHTYVSLLLDRQEAGKKVGNNLNEMCDGWLRSESGTGKAEAGVYPQPDTINPSLLPLVDSQSLESIPEWSPQTWDDVKTRFVVTYNDRDHNFKERSVKYDDPKARTTLGENRIQSLRRNYITRADQAYNHAVDMGRRFSLPGMDGKLTLRPAKGAALRPGNHVRIDIDPEPGGVQLQQVCRVKSITRPAKGSAKLSVEIEPTLTPILYTPPVTPPVNPAITVPAIEHYRFFEMPPPLADGSDFGVGVLASRPDALITDLAVMYDPDDDSASTFPPLGSHRSFALKGRLTAAYGTAATGPVSVEIIASHADIAIDDNPGDVAARNDELLMLVFGAPDTSGGGYIQPLEIFSVSEIVSTGSYLFGITALRSRQGTPIGAHAVNDEVWFIRRANLPWYRHKDFETKARAGASCFFKLQPSTYLATRDIADCDPIEFRFGSSRVYAPIITIETPVYDDGQIYASVLTNHSLIISGSVADRDSNLVRIQVLKRFDGNETISMDRSLPGVASATFSQRIRFEDAGLNVVIVRATDSSGYTVETWLNVNAGTTPSTNTLSVASVAAPDTIAPGTDAWVIHLDEPADPSTTATMGNFIITGGVAPYTIEMVPDLSWGEDVNTMTPDAVYPGERIVSGGSRVTDAQSFAVYFYGHVSGGGANDLSGAGHWAHWFAKVTDDDGNIAYSPSTYAEIFNTFY